MSRFDVGDHSDEGDHDTEGTTVIEKFVFFLMRVLCRLGLSDLDIFIQMI